MVANVFAHESGIHQDEMLKSKSTDEIISPKVIGLQRTDVAGNVLGGYSFLLFLMHAPSRIINC